MWDVHTRIGGFAGSLLLLADCPASRYINTPITAANQVDGDCLAAFMSLHLSKTSQGLYLENVWLWVADHDIEDPELRRLSIYAARGLYSESTKGNFWLWGTSSEHHVFSQYQFANTKNVFMGQIQTETAYFQPNPKASVPYTALTAWNDPVFKTSCTGVSGNCEAGWGLRIINSTDLFVYGAGLYSFFNNYSTSKSLPPLSWDVPCWHLDSMLWCRKWCLLPNTHLQHRRISLQESGSLQSEHSRKSADGYDWWKILCQLCSKPECLPSDHCYVQELCTLRDGTGVPYYCILNVCIGGDLSNIHT